MIRLSPDLQSSPNHAEDREMLANPRPTNHDTLPLTGNRWFPIRCENDGRPYEPSKPELDMIVNQPGVIAERRRRFSDIHQSFGLTRLTRGNVDSAPQAPRCDKIAQVVEDDNHLTFPSHFESMQMFIRVLATLFFTSLNCLPLLPARCQADESLRVTPTVTIIEKVQAAVLPVFTQTGPSSGGTGSGVMIHPSGFVLTADHVTQNYPGVLLFGLQREEYDIVGRLPERDLAILKVKKNDYTTTYVPIGRSLDLKAGDQ